jgi:uncharacterized RDD family membrane protein YckC
LLIDSLIGLLPYFASLIIGTGVNSILNFGDASGAGSINLAAYTAALVVSTWNVIVRQGLTGQSIGKQVLGIRVIALDTGQPLGVGRNLLRYVSHFADSLLCYIGYLLPLWDERRQTIADKIVNSAVVRTG